MQKSMARVYFSFLFVVLSYWCTAQSAPLQIKWKNLEDVSFKETYLNEFEDWFLVPTFGVKVKELNNRIIDIKGYVIPLDLDGKIYALSAYPFSSCFFCGAAGPESVMTLLFENGPPRKYKTDEVARFKGVLMLNSKNPEEFIYVLKEVKEIPK